MGKNFINDGILILGTTPLPIGGVTIHVQRMLYFLSQNKVKFHFLDINKSSKLKLLKVLFCNNKIHLHSSNVYLRFMLCLFGKITFKKIDFTLHGDLGRYKSKFKNTLDIFSIWLANKPILLNKRSLLKALKYNKNSILGTSFLPPNIEKEVLEEVVKKRVLKFKDHNKLLFCTNAYNFSHDRDGKEIYGIFELIEAFTCQVDYGLIISDPSGAYKSAIEAKGLKLPQNILIISYPHSFYKIIEFSDASIRNTSTDGDSISVKESLYLNKMTLCTNVVSRPEGVIEYAKGDLLNILRSLNFKEFKENKSIKKEFDASLDKLIDLYR